MRKETCIIAGDELCLKRPRETLRRFLRFIAEDARSLRVHQDIMAAPKGNRFWEARSSHGRNPIFKSPEDLSASCAEYFEWVEENPLWEMKPFAFQGTVTQEPVAKMRAMTINGLCNFLDIGTSTWDDYRGRKDFSAVCSRVEQIIKQQKFEGASADLLNPSIIARDLGLTDKLEHSGGLTVTLESDAERL